jgi:prolyl-tRNA editing enzyme YbaK/EbsC (Cys-tRNA(Pro) deacylase)
LGSRERVAEALGRSGARFELREFDESTRSSALAAEALGCTVAEIAKSVVFMGKKPIVVITSGDKRVDVKKLEVIAGQKVRVAGAEEVRELTGFPIGGVPPFPHNPGVMVLPDRSITRFQEVWAAAGSPNTVFRMGTVDLMNIVGSGAFDLSE